MIIVFPMAGDSRRFAERGYRQPKYQLPIHGASLFDHVINGFSAYFAAARFLFVSRGLDEAMFVAQRCAALGVANPDIVTLERNTAGQAETVLLGIDAAAIDDAAEVTVFNIDTIRARYREPPIAADRSRTGYLEVFRGAGTGWSYVRPDPAECGGVAEVAEKKPISDLCCTGLYHFRRAGDFRWAYRHPAPPRSGAERRERFVAPLYNALIARGDRIAYAVIEPSDAIFCGIPEQYEEARSSEEIGRQLRP